MFHLQKLLIVVILIGGALSFDEVRKSRWCLVCTGNRDFCSLAKLGKILWEDCFEEPQRVKQDDDGCFHHNHNGMVERGCLSRLAPTQYKDCKESEWCKKCYTDKCNDEQYFVNRTTAPLKLDPSVPTLSQEASAPANYESKIDLKTESNAASMKQLSFGLISSFILVAIAAF